MFHSLRSRIAFAYTVLIILLIISITAAFLALLRGFYLADLEQKLIGQARIVGEMAAPALIHRDDIETIDATVQHWGELLSARITLIRADGVVLGDSYEDAFQMENHSNRPEIQEAIQTGQGVSLRHSTTLGYDVLYVAVPIREGERLLGVARVSLPLSQISAALSTVRNAAAVSVMVTSVIAVIVAILIAEGTLRPVRALTKMTRRLTEGDLSARLPLISEDELGTLTQTLNQMAARLQETMRALSRERTELATILSRLTDGLLVIDTQGQVTRMNPAARHILHLPAHINIGCSLVEMVRDHEIVEVWQHTQRKDELFTKSVEKEDKLLQVTAAPIPEVGYLLLLQDLTEVRRLTTVRRDFVANVSHELRTPLASLKLLTETLQRGAWQDQSDATYFLGRMDEELDRLIQMVQELMGLSRLESGQAPLQMVPLALDGIVAQATKRLRPQIERAGLKLIVECPDELPKVLADAQGIEQVMINLLHNAIKFTPSGSITVTSRSVRVEGSNLEILSGHPCSASAEPLPGGYWVLVSITDSGVGIRAADLSRIFERFYKGDRSRAGGGTGLGLAIARHTIKAHNGCLWAESVEGKGSTFHIALPALTRP